jgi:adenylate kinase
VRVVLLGPPGAGKGTQAQIIAGRLGVPAISTGDIFRANVSGQTELGQQAKAYMDAGDLVPDEITVAMVSDRLAEPDAKAGFLLDGFPRTIAQAEQLRDSLAEMGHSLDRCLELVVDEDELVRRLSGRRMLVDGEWVQRDDDKPETVSVPTRRCARPRLSPTDRARTETAGTWCTVIEASPSCPGCPGWRSGVDA